MSAKELVKAVTSEQNLAQFASVLPSHISADQFAKVLTTSIFNDPKLANAKPESLMKEATQIAALGLSTDTQRGEAYLIVDFKNNVQRRIGYRGLIKLMRQGGMRTVYAEAVHENDEFSIVLGTDKRIEHVPTIKDRGEPIGYYAVMKDADGFSDFEWMTIEELHKIRDTRSDGWKAFKLNKIKSTPWSTDEGEMCKKTVLRRLSKRAPMENEKSADALARAFDAEDAAENATDVTPKTESAGQRMAKNGASVNSLSDLVDFHKREPETTDINPDTGEVIEGEADPKPEEKMTVKDMVTLLADTPAAGVVFNIEERLNASRAMMKPGQITAIERALNGAKERLGMFIDEEEGSPA